MKTSMPMMRAMLLLGLWLGGMQAVQAQTRTMHLYYTDPQGTVLAKTDAQGTILATYDYTPYGSLALGAAPDGPGYTGHVNDPKTGLVYMQARYYHPDGRFLSPDPVEPSPGNIYSFNRYAYANNNPVVNIDPTGAFSDGMDESRMSGWGGWRNQTFWRDDRCAVCLQTSGGSGQVTNMDPVYVSARSSHSGVVMSAAGRATDGIFSVTFGTMFNLMKRPEHPTRIPNKLAHELYMINGTAVITALAPNAVIVGGSATPGLAEGGGVIVDAAGNVVLRYGPRAAMLGCLSLSCRGEPLPEQYAKDREMLQKVYEEAKIVESEMFPQIFESGKR